MHTILVIAAGLVLLGACLLAGRAAGRPLAAAAMWFLPLWLAGAAANMWIGVNHAGYTYAQEFPIFLLVFAVPAVIAVAVRLFSRS
ncbi:MAG: hypothetical protein AB7K67_10395 [Hyphomicrobiaceae bacterium]|jgi:hypothetical protein